MFNPLGEFKFQNPFEGMQEIKNPLEPQENEDNPFIFTGLINPFELEDEDEEDDD
jgi:hypothetical protein